MDWGQVGVWTSRVDNQRMGKDAGLPATTLVRVLDPTPCDLHGLGLAHLRLRRLWGAHNNAWGGLGALGWLWVTASTGWQCLTLAIKDPVNVAELAYGACAIRGALATNCHPFRTLKVHFLTVCV